MIFNQYTLLLFLFVIRQNVSGSALVLNPAVRWRVVGRIHLLAGNSSLAYVTRGLTYYLGEYEVTQVHG